MTRCYYRRLPPIGDVQAFESTEYTGSNWDQSIQHGSPPLALMTKLIEEQAPPGMRIGRLVLDILGPIPVAPVRVRAWVQRPGARISLLAAEMSATRPDGSERTVAGVSAWLLATGDTVDIASDRYPPITEGEADPTRHAWQGAPGYLDSIRWERQRAGDAGAAVSWLSPLVSLVDGDDVTDMQRLAMVVDSANGAGAALDPDEFLFMNTDTAVHLHRVPRGNDFGLRARVHRSAPTASACAMPRSSTARGSSGRRRRRCWCSGAEPRRSRGVSPRRYAQPMDTGDLESRVTALEGQVRDLTGRVRATEQDAAGRPRARRSRRPRRRRDPWRPARFPQGHHGWFQRPARQDFVDLRQDFVDLREHVDHGFTEMRGKFDAAAAGQQQIVDLLHTIIDDKGSNGPTE